MDIVVDASVVLAACLPDESTPQAQRLMRDYALGTVDLWAPRLLLLELLNVCLVAARRGRLEQSVLDGLATYIAALQINWVNVEEQPKRILSVARQLGLTAYDTAYIVAAQMRNNCMLVTADKRMFVSAKEAFPFVVLLEDYKGASGTRSQPPN